jgi:hypothetical protein
LVVLDPKSGEPRFSPHDMGIRPARNAVLTDANGDGSTDLLFLEPTRTIQSTAANDPPVRLIAWSLDPPRELWRSDLGSRYWLPPSPILPFSNWPLAADLDGDGADEILVPTDPATMSGRGTLFPTLPAGWLTLLDGATGTPRWTRRLRTIDSQVDQFTIGPDVDGDGQRDIFVATLLYRETELFVDCLSGANGETIWWTSQRLDIRDHDFRELWVTGLTWWNLGEDGWPRLLVSVRPGENDTRHHPVVYAFSAGTGTLLGRGPKLEELHLADADGDGRDELYSFRPWGARDQGGKLDILRGGPQDAWRRLGESQWSPVGDLDGDGVGDVAAIRSDASLLVVSGDTERRSGKAACRFL